MNKTVTPYSNEPGTKKQQVADMFNNISKTYDFLNHFLSLGIDIIWRKKAIGELKNDHPCLILLSKKLTAAIWAAVSVLNWGIRKNCRLATTSLMPLPLLMGLEILKILNWALATSGGF